MFEKDILKNAEFVEIISCFLVNFYFYFLLYVTRMLVYPYKCRIQPKTMSQMTIYTPLLLPRTHTHEKQEPQFMLPCRCDYDERKKVMMVETEWVIISKEAVGNSWDILNAILRHKYHSNQSNSFISNE